MFKESLAGTGRDYVALQAYVRGGESLHIQGDGPEVNREYGVAVDIPISNFTQDIVDWFNQLPKPLQSKVSEKTYFPLQAVINEGDYDDDYVIHFQVPGPELNRDYGASFDVEGIEDLESFITLQKE